MLLHVRELVYNKRPTKGVHEGKKERTFSSDTTSVSRSVMSNCFQEINNHLINLTLKIIIVFD